VKSVFERGMFSRPADLDAIKRSFRKLVESLPRLCSDRDVDAHTMKIAYSSVMSMYSDLHAAMKALRDCTEVIPPLESPVEIPPDSTYSQVIKLLRPHLETWEQMEPDDVYDVSSGQGDRDHDDHWCYEA